MRAKAILIALVIGLAFSAGPALGASAGASGECSDANADEGGGGSVAVSEDGVDDGVDEEEAQSIADGVALFFTNGANCPDDGTGYIGGGASAADESAGLCYDDDGVHASAPDDGCTGDAILP